MPRFLIPLMIATTQAAAAPPDTPVKAYEAQLQKVIVGAAPSVVVVVASHRKDYDRLPPAEAAKPGRLGEFHIPRQPEDPRGQMLREPKPDRRDLSAPENLADNQFGSGLVLDASKGLVLTPYHLIEGATKVYIRAANGKGSYADIHAADARADLAVLRLLRPVAGLEDARLGKAQLVVAPDGSQPNLRTGSTLIVLGYPLASGFGDGPASASTGILSGIRRRTAPPMNGEESRYNRPLHQLGSLIQTDARLALNSSGAALVNLDGEVVGLSSAVAAVTGSEASGGFAIPFDANYRRIIERLRGGHEVEYGFLGVQPENAINGGVTLKKVTPGCPASLAGLEVNDVLREIDGHVLRDQDDLLIYVGAALAGSEVTAKVQRDGRTIAKKIVLSKFPNTLASIASTIPVPYHGLKVDWSSIKLVPFFQDRIGFHPVDPPQGVCIRELDPGSAAGRKLTDLLAPAQCWILTHVDDKPVANPVEFAKATAGKASVKLRFTDALDAESTKTFTLP